MLTDRLFAGQHAPRSLTETQDLASLDLVRVLAEVFATPDQVPLAQRAVLRLVRLRALVCRPVRLLRAIHAHLTVTASPPVQLHACFLGSPNNFCRVRSVPIVERLLSVYHTLQVDLQRALLAFVGALVLDGHRLTSELEAYSNLLKGTEDFRNHAQEEKGR